MFWRRKAKTEEQRALEARVVEIARNGPYGNHSSEYWYGGQSLWHWHCGQPMAIVNGGYFEVFDQGCSQHERRRRVRGDIGYFVCSCPSCNYTEHSLPNRITNAGM
jgi:hypothetical protein